MASGRSERWERKHKKMRQNVKTAIVGLTERKIAFHIHSHTLSFMLFIALVLWSPNTKEGNESKNFESAEAPLAYNLRGKEC